MFQLDNIELKNFRCYKNAYYSFLKDKKIIFVGKNASGKTSVIEAIYYLAFGKSFKTTKDEELINNSNENNTLYLKAKFSDNEIIEIGYNGENKVFKKSGVKVKSLSKMVGYFLIALFCPDDLLLIKGEPSDRRKFIDSNLCQIDKEYLIALQNMKKTLKERNEYLKIVDADEKKLNINYLDTITYKFIEASKIIEEKRIKFIKEIGEIAKEIALKISGNNDLLSVEFIPNVNVDNFWITYNEKKMLDLYAKTTTWGPQRDDFLVKINQKTAHSSASQGQVRTSSLALKLAVVECFKKYSKNIIIVLDDVFSELDENRQNEILKYLNSDNQVFITTTNINLLTKNALENSEIIEIVRGD